MKKPRKKFVLAEANLKEVNKQLNINMFVISILAMMLGLDIAHFMQAYSLFYGVLIVIMAVLLYLTLKSRKLLMMRKQELKRYK
ncbi:hypothetical protein J3492_06450 [Psychrobacter sp. F1192]|uniref:Uncharacterized protein n=1 Tax=Psychrobacter coccoides TaxID=2818440 RepID=A0ABS3NND5_9GAMM|nr:hypothetical protein [Psychrobacter coccoides]MBO1530853.1 hypothetical protein [Psychrobacter coccoides]